MQNTMFSKIMLIFVLVLFAVFPVQGQSQKAKEPVQISNQITGKYVIPESPEWVNNAVFYQIYPQTFYDSDNDGIGDLQGIIQKLDYIKSLGVDGVWINPFFESPFNDAGYDISDYYKVAPRYGTNEDAKQLFEEAHKKGLKILFDFVASYTSMEHPWFKASAQQKENKYTNWYIWTDNIWNNPPRSFSDSFVKGMGTRNGQYLRNFFYSQPALNYGFSNPDPKQKWELGVDHPDVLSMREEMKNVVRYWMSLGADGFRADMAGSLAKTDRTTGNEQFFTTQEDATKSFWREVRAMLKEEFPQAFIVSEWSSPVTALDGCFHADFFHWFDGYNDLFQKEGWRILNGVSEGYSYFDVEGKGNITHFLEKYMEQYLPTVGKGYICLPLGNHDNARLGNQRTDTDLEMIYAFGLTMPGVTFLYYGNEIGMRQLPETWPQVEGAYKPRNGARTPMQWTGGKNLGFSYASEDKLYLPVDPAQDAPNVAAQEKDPNSLLNKTRQLIRLKHTEPALANYAEFIPLYAKENTYPFVYARAKDKDVVVVFMNPSGKEVSAEFELNVDFKKTLLLAGKDLKLNKSGKTISVMVPAQTYSVIKLQ